MKQFKDFNSEIKVPEFTYYDESVNKLIGRFHDFPISGEEGEDILWSCLEIIDDTNLMYGIKVSHIELEKEPTFFMDGEPYYNKIIACLSYTPVS